MSSEPEIYNIRTALPEDMPMVMSLISELAVYEKAPEEVVNTVENLTRDGFGQHPLFYCAVVEYGGQITGFALTYYRYSTWKGKCMYLEDLYVREEYRGRGMGRMLFEHIVEKAREDHCVRLNWQVLDWNMPAIKFYEKYQAGFDSSWWNGFIDLSEG